MNSEWRYELRIRLTEELSNQQLDELIDAAARSDWDVMRDPVRITLVTYGPDPQPADALQLLWSEAAAWLATLGRTGNVVSGRVATEDLAEEEALRPDAPGLLSAPDVGELLGVSRQRVHQLHTDHPDFPAPYARLGSGPIWTRPAIEAFERRWTRRPGRPARAAG